LLRRVAQLGVHLRAAIAADTVAERDQGFVALHKPVTRRR